MNLTCWNCGYDLAGLPLPISRHANCDGCGEVLHCCRFCQHFAVGRPGDCDQELADPPSDKTTANFCEYFKPDPGAYQGKGKDAGDSNSAAKARLASLFGEEAPETDPQANPLDDLFKD